jgi:hypothetical protein
MYSFVPAKPCPADGPIAGFPRVSLGNASIKTSQFKTQGYACFNREISDIVTFWEEIKKICKEQGFVEAVHLNMPGKE